MRRQIRHFVILAAAFAMVALANAAVAGPKVGISVAGGNKTLLDALKSSSLTYDLRKNDTVGTQDILSAANADYRVLVETLYSLGYYASTVSIRLDGREAASVDVFAVPKSIRAVSITVNPGRLFRFGSLRLGPLPPGLKPDPAFATGKRALSTVISDRTQAAVDGWRAEGHPLAKIASQSVVANHANGRLTVDVKIDPGPSATFGNLIVTGDTKVRHAKILKIAGLRRGEPYSTNVLTTVADRLKRIPAFGSVVLTEADHLNPDGTIDITAQITDRARHRMGFGLEYDTEQGLQVTGYWIDRNLFRGAEQFRVDASVSNLGDPSAGTDYSIGARLENPSRRRVDTTTFYTAKYENLDEPSYKSESTTIGAGFSRIFNSQSNGQIELDVSKSRATDDLGTRSFLIFSLPVTATLDKRDQSVDPGKGYYLKAGTMPFVDVENKVTGLRSTLDARAYHRFDGKTPITLAGRMQVGSLAGASIDEAQPDYLFYSGGGGTVRGQPYQSLGVDLGGGVETGGRSFLGFSAEVRARIKGDYGAVAFVDTGYIGEESFPNGHSGKWQTGAGVGFRYFTSLGPFRVDLGWPVPGGSGSGVQLYIGFGQAF